MIIVTTLNKKYSNNEKDAVLVHFVASIYFYDDYQNDLCSEKNAKKQTTDFFAKFLRVSIENNLYDLGKLRAAFKKGEDIVNRLMELSLYSDVVHSENRDSIITTFLN